MKLFSKLTIVTTLFLLTVGLVTGAVATEYKYSIYGSAVSSTVGGNLELDMSIEAKIRVDNRIDASVSVLGSFNGGTMYLFMNDYQNTYNNELTSVAVGSVVTVVPLYGDTPIKALSPNWQIENGVEIMKIYGRYENTNGAQWVGPIKIKRTPIQNVINLKVTINPSEAVADGAQWRYKGSEIWYNSGETKSIDINAFVNPENPFADPEMIIEYKNITGWTVAASRTVYLKEGEDVNISGMYSGFQCQVTVHAKPEATQVPILDEAYWRVYFVDTGNDSGFFKDDYLLDLTPGGTWVQFKDFDGYVSPGDPNNENKILFTAESGQLHQFDVEYCKQIPDTPVIYNMEKNVYTDRVFFEWNAVSSAECRERQGIKYNIFRSETNDPATANLLIQGTLATEYTDQTLVPGVIYYYWITAFSTIAGSGESPKLAEGEPAYLKLDKITSLSSEDRVDDIELQFNSINGAIIYEVKRSKSSTDINDSISLGLTSETIFIDDHDVVPYINYTYWIIPKNLFQAGPPSNSVTDHIILYPPEALDITTESCDCISIDFPLNPKATHYVWDKVLPDTDTRKQSRVDNFDAPPFKDCTLIPGEKYFYKVKACNPFGCSIYSNEAPGKANLCPVSSVSATDEDSNHLERVVVSWTNSPKATKYIVHACTSSTLSDSCTAFETASNPFTHSVDNDPNILDFPSYYYFVTALNSSTQSVPAGDDQGTPYRCRYNMSPTTSRFGPDAGTGSFVITEVDGCHFELRSDVDWITNLNPQTGGNGNETATFSVASYDGTDQRVGHITLLGNHKEVVHTVTQDSSLFLSINISPANAGTVTVSPTPSSQSGNVYYYAPGTSVTIQATPAEFFEFRYWSGAFNDTANPKTFTLNNSSTVTAIFEIPKKQLSMTGQGPVELDNNGSPVNLPSQTLHDKDTVVHIKSLLNCPTGYLWTGDVPAGSMQQSIDLTMDTDKAVNVVCCEGWNFSLNASWIDASTTNEKTETVQIGLGCQDYSEEASSDARFYLTTPEKDVLNSLHYLPATEENPYWILAVKAGSEDVTIEWTAPTDTAFYQIRESETGIGKAVLWDMKETTSYTVPASSDIQYFTINRSDQKWPSIIRSIRAHSKPYVIFGIEPTAYTMEAPPLDPPEYATKIIISPNERLMADVRKSGNDIERWVIQVNPKGEYGLASEEATCTLTWEPRTFQESGTYKLIEGWDAMNTLGDVVVEDMRTTTSFDVTGYSTYQYFTIEWNSIVPNDPPEISPINDQTMDGLNTIGPIAFTVTDPDEDEITVSATSSNGNVVPDANIQLLGEGDNRTVSITPVAFGETTITIIASDGKAQATETFKVIVNDPDQTTLFFNTEIDHGRNQTSDIPIEITNVKGLGGCELKIQYNPEFITINSAVLGDFLGSTGRTATVIKNENDVENGILSFTAMTFSGPAGASGQGVIVNLNVTTSKAGTTGLTLTDVQFTDTVGTVIPLVLKNQSIIIGRSIISLVPEDLKCFGVCTTTVKISDAEDFGGYEVQLTIDPDIISVTEIEPGDFLTSTGRTALDLTISETDPGTVKFAKGSLGSAAGPSGEGVLFTVTWESEANNTGDDIISAIQIDTTETQLTTTNGTIIPFKSENQTLTVPACYLYDIDCDCDVDIVDIMTVVGQYEFTPDMQAYNPRCDIDFDDDIDIVDIMTVVGQYDWKCPTAKKGKTRKETTPQPMRLSLPTVAIGETFEMSMKGLGLENAAAFEYKLSFNKDAYQIVNIHFSDYIESTGRAATIVQALTDNEAGMLSYAVVTMNLSGLTPGVYGNGILTHIVWKRIADGSADFTLEEHKLTDPIGTILETSVLDPFTIVQNNFTTEIEAGDDTILAFMNGIADPNSGLVELEWSLPVDENTEFHIYRAETPDGTYEEITDEPVTADSQGDFDLFHFNDGQTAPGKTYSYRIDVVNSQTQTKMAELFSDSIPALSGGIELSGGQPMTCDPPIPTDVNDDCKTDLEDLLIILQTLSGFPPQ